MDTTLIAALAALGGSVVGGTATFLTTWLNQRLQGRKERLFKELDRREDLYGQFNRLASELLLDSIDHHLDEPAKLAEIMPLLGSIRLASSDRVLFTADAVMTELLASYARPPQDWRELITAPYVDFVNPLIAFAEACRSERNDLLRQLG